MSRSVLAPVAIAAAALAALVVLPACSSLPTTDAAPALEAGATLRDAAGKTVGAVRFTQPRTGGVQLEVTVAGLTVGTHGIHLHAVGACEASGATAFGAAGSHFNPHAASHGLENPRGAHAGDLPNLVVGVDGAGVLRTTTERVTLAAGAASVLDADGTAVVIHAGPDDQASDPAGNSGVRIACGVVQAR